MGWGGRPLSRVPLTEVSVKPGEFHPPPGVCRGEACPLLALKGRTLNSPGLQPRVGRPASLRAPKGRPKLQRSAGPSGLGGSGSPIPGVATPGCSKAAPSGRVEGLKTLCSEVRKIGAPTYFPRYMIQHGLGAVVGDTHRQTFDDSKQ